MESTVVDCESELIIRAESGTVIPMRKDPNFFKFHADWHNHNTKRTAPRYFDFNDFHLKQEGLEWTVSPKTWECHICGHDFRRNRWAYQLSAGAFNGHDEFVIDSAMLHRQAVLCMDCIYIFDD